MQGAFLNNRIILQSYHIKKRLYSKRTSSLHSRFLQPTYRKNICQISKPIFQQDLSTNTNFISKLKSPFSNLKMSNLKQPLVWIDCEMTGLEVGKHVLMEVAAIITDGNLRPVEEKFDAVIKLDEKQLSEMNDWCIEQHGKSGLTERCRQSNLTVKDVENQLLAYIKKYIPKKREALIAGNSVHADVRFLSVEMPKIIEHLHYRIIDVSTIKELAKRWRPDIPAYDKKGDHRALSDILESIGELQHYRSYWLF
ncbi:putative oligoribonuclease [Schizosaccharomyces pombe]